MHPAPRPVTGGELLAMSSEVLRSAGVPVAVVRAPTGPPVVELLVSARRWRAAVEACGSLPWRWRAGADDASRLLGRAMFAFDGQALLVVQRSLPAYPWAPWRLRRLTRRLRRRPDPEARAAVAAVTAARGGRFSAPELAAVDASASALDVDAVAAAAGDRWLASVVRSVTLAARNAASDETEGPLRAPAELPALRPVDRLAAVVQRRLPRRVRRVLAGDLFGSTVVRCRFAGLELLAGPSVFLPRRPSEQLVTRGRELLAGVSAPRVVDVGTGCGAVALALAAHRPDAAVRGVELDASAARWARRNARRLGRPDVRFLVGSLLDPVAAEGSAADLDLVVANIPCVRDAVFEPQGDAHASTFVGADDDGLGLQRQLAGQALRLLRPGARLLVQLAPDQVERLSADLAARGFTVGEAHGDAVAVVLDARLPAADPA